MKYSEWEPIYKQISADFKFDYDKDKHASETLKELLKQQTRVTTDELSKLINDRVVYVFGAGPDLDSEIANFDRKTGSKSVIIAADGATSALLKKKLVPDIIVTDLDGYIPDQLTANEQGALLVIHAHGDNVEILNRWVPKFKGGLFGTTQTEPDEKNGIYNFGGFTDGDRAIFLAAHFEASRIMLLAFDFNKIGKYSYRYRSKTKLRKLTWAHLLIGMIKKPPVIFLPTQRKSQKLKGKM